MQHVTFHQPEELLGEHDTYTAAYATFLHSANVPPSLEEDVFRLDQQSQQSAQDDTEVIL